MRDRVKRPKTYVPAWLKRLSYVVGALALLSTAFPALLFVGLFCVFLLPFVIPFLFYEGERELMEELAHPPDPHLRWDGSMPHPEAT